MAYATTSDRLLHFALYSGLAVFLLTLALLATIAVLRYVIDRRERRERELTARWHPVFFHAIEGLPQSVPSIFGHDRETILLLWIHFTESIRGEARQRLRQLALDIKLDHTARKLLGRRKLRLRLLAIVTLGRLRVADAWDDLVTLIRSPNPALSLLSARSLLQIDAKAALPIMLNEMLRRDDWPLVKVAAMLREIPPELLAPQLVTKLMAALHQTTPANAPLLLSLLETTHLGDTWPVLHPMLNPSQPAEVITAALKACKDARALDAARQLAADPRWIVRAQAAVALGRLGSDEDRLRLQAMLSDPEWWVRYRAALALTALPNVSRPRLLALCEQLTDRFAIDILKQALAETAPESTS